MISILFLLLYRRSKVSTLTPTIGAYVSCWGVFRCYFYQVLKCSLQTSSNSSSLASRVATITACGKAYYSRNTDYVARNQTSNHGIMTWNKKRANIAHYNKISSASRLFFYHWFTLVRPMLGNPRQSWTARSGFRFPGTGLGFLVRGTWIPDSLIWVMDSKAEGFGFHKHILPRIPESEWPYRARFCICGISTVRKSSSITDFLYFHKKLTWTNYPLIFYNAVTNWLQLVGG